jgi:hypothetical protein
MKTTELRKALRADLAKEVAKLETCRKADDRTGIELARVQIKLIERELLEIA